MAIRVSQPRQRLLNTSIAMVFGTAASVWTLPVLAQAQTASQAAAGAEQSGGVSLPRVTVKAAADETGTSRVNGYVAKRSTTGTKTDTPIIETPQSISVVTSDRYDAMGAHNIKDALTYTPGVIPTVYGADSRYSWMSLRGFDAYSPGFYLDTMPLRNNGNWGVWKTENYGSERIEVLRGPSSVLYGLSSPGGLVNIVSKRPSADPIREIQLSVGDYDRRQIAADFSGPIDADGKLLYRITGLVRDAELPAGDMRDDYTYIAPSFTWNPSSNTSLTVLSQFSRTRAGVYSRMRPAVGSLVPTPIGTVIPASLFSSDTVNNRFNLDQSLIGYLFEHRINDTFSVRQNGRYGHLKVDYAAVQGRAFETINPDVADDPLNFAFIRRTVSGSREKVTAFNLDNQLQAKWESGDWQHTVLVGLDYQRSRIDQYSFAGGSASPLSIDNPVYGGPVSYPDPWFDGITTVRQTGFYLQDQIKWRNRWIMTLGARYDRSNSSISSRLDQTRTSIAENKATKRVGLNYVAENGWAPYVSYAESFAPTATLDAETKQPFKPETGRQYETGIRYEPPGRKTRYSAAIFDLRRRNYITYDDNFQPRQTGEVLVRGVELEATTEILPRLNLAASYSYTPKAEITASSTASEIGKPLIAVPRSVGALWADYRFGNGLKVGLGGRFTGSNHGALDAAPAKVPSSTVFDAMIGYDYESWNLALNVRNLTDKDYFANCDQYSTCYYGDPRRVTATATYRW